MQVAGNAMSNRESDAKPMVVNRPYESGSTDLIFVEELMHRINNQLTSTISFASQTAARSSSGEVKVALAGVIENLLDCARVYRALQMPTELRPIDAAEYLRDLCMAISRATLQHKRIDLVLVEQPLRLNSSQCWRLGMILAELVTNSCRHAFTENGGTITVEFERRGGRVECSVSDEGSAKENIRPGLGLTIIQRLAEGLHGEISVRLGKAGSVAIVSFPFVEPIEGS
jgi:two-component sensor histidine kinase